MKNINKNNNIHAINFAIGHYRGTVSEKWGTLGHWAAVFAGVVNANPSDHGNMSATSALVLCCVACFCP
jgi:hypothetical protein